MIVNIAAFLVSPYRNQWLTIEHGELYVRKGHRILKDKRVSTFDLANVIVDPRYRGQKIFTSLLDSLEQELTDYKIEAIYVENIQELQLLPFLEKRGYEYDQRTADNCLYKIVTKG